MGFEAKLKELGITLPDPAKPADAYLPALRDGDYVYTSGQIPLVKGQLKFQGKVGKDLPLEEGYEGVVFDEKVDLFSCFCFPAPVALRHCLSQPSR